jgi:hypothetical protein
MAAGEEDVGGDRVRDLAGQTHGRSAQREQPPPRLGHPEPGALAGDPDVGGLQDLGTAGDRRALHGRDQRFGEPAALQQRLDGRQVPAVGAVAGMRLGHGPEIGPGAERATGAGEDARADPGIGVDLVPGLAHDRHHRTGQRVALAGTVHGDHEDRPLPLDEGVRRLRCGIHIYLLGKGLFRTITRSTF